MWLKTTTYLFEKVRSIFYSCSKHEKGFIPIQYSVGIITKQCTLGLINDFKHFLSFWQSNRNNIRFGTTGCIFKSHFISLSHYREGAICWLYVQVLFMLYFYRSSPLPTPPYLATLRVSPLPIWPPSEFHPSLSGHPPSFTLKSPWPVNCCLTTFISIQVFDFTELNFLFKEEYVPLQFIFRSLEWINSYLFVKVLMLAINTWCCT